MMLKIGLTGGIGSGKTTVSQVFQVIGVPIFCADDIAKQIYDIDTNVQQQMIAAFGSDIYFDNKTINKQLLASKIFGNDKLLATVNNIVHPAVYKHFCNWATKQTSKYIIIEAAILFESGFEKYVDKTINVYAPEQLRINRAITRDNTNAEKIINRIKAQITDEERCRRADFVIVNDDKTPVLPQIIEIDKKLKNLLVDNTKL